MAEVLTTTGRGEVDDPVTRWGTCAVRDCGDNVAEHRLTGPGFFVGYCRPHAIEAERLFERSDDE
jgi:hypothetical protein